MKTSIGVGFAIAFLTAPIEAQLTVGNQPRTDTTISAATTAASSVRAWWNQKNTTYPANESVAAAVFKGVVGVSLPGRGRPKFPNHTHCKATVPDSILFVSPTHNDRLWVKPVGQRCVSSTPHVIFSDGRRTREFTPQELGYMGGSLTATDLTWPMTAYPMRAYMTTARGLDGLHVTDDHHRPRGGFWIRPLSEVRDSIQSASHARALATHNALSEQAQRDSIAIEANRRNEALRAEAERQQATERESRLRASLDQDGASAAQVAAALRGAISLGLTKRSVLLIWGVPDRQTVSAEGLDIWSYLSGRAVRFHSGRVVAFTQ